MIPGRNTYVPEKPKDHRNPQAPKQNSYDTKVELNTKFRANSERTSRPPKIMEQNFVTQEDEVIFQDR